MENKMNTLEDLVRIIRILRSENGCPWDRVQTHASIRMDMLEEAYEAADAIDKKDMKNLCEELGDVLMQVVMHSQIAREEGRFDVQDVISGISRKMIRRHPHVFGTEEEKANPPGWEEIKKREKEGKSQKGVLPEEFPREFSALMRAQKLYKKLQKKQEGSPADPDKIPEYVKECLNLARTAKDSEEARRQIGQALWHIVGLAQNLGISAEVALGDTADGKSLKNT